MMPERELKPCPYCGEREELYPAYMMNKDGIIAQPPYAIDCLGCGFDFTPRQGVDAIDAWNKRADGKPRDYSDTPEDYDVWNERQARSHRRGKYAIWAMAILGVLIFAYATLTDADAHDWYPAVCCSGRDCGEIPASAVKEGPNGFVVTILPGQHVMVKDAPVQYLIPYGTEKPSPDGLTHICLNPALKMLCFFTGNRGV